MCFSPWQKNENVETDIELLLQDFDDEIEEIQVQAEDKACIHVETCPSHDGVWSSCPDGEHLLGLMSLSSHQIFGFPSSFSKLFMKPERPLIDVISCILFFTHSLTHLLSLSLPLSLHPLNPPTCLVSG